MCWCFFYYHRRTIPGASGFAISWTATYSNLIYLLWIWIWLLVPKLIAVAHWNRFWMFSCAYIYISPCLHSAAFFVYFRIIEESIQVFGESDRNQWRDVLLLWPLAFRTSLEAAILSSCAAWKCFAKLRWWLPCQRVRRADNLGLGEVQGRRRKRGQGIRNSIQTVTSDSSRFHWSPGW